MAAINLIDGFGIKFAENGNTFNFEDTQYKSGWAFIGDNPPTVEQFNYVSWLQDAKSNFLFSLIKSVTDEQGVEIKENTPEALKIALGKAIGKASSTSVQHFKAGSPLPSTNIGPIWHADYASIMTWVTYSENGASYTGYASVDVGLVTAESQPTLRTGYIRSGATSYNQATYPILWNWAKHNGLVQNAATWKAKTGFYRDNGDGTFTPPDLTDQHIRFSGTGRDVGSFQGDAMRKINGGVGAPISSGQSGPFKKLSTTWWAREGSAGDGHSFVETDFDISRVVPVADQVQVVTTAFLPAIKH